MTQDATIPSPRDHLGFDVGDDRKLADWPETVAYFELLAKSSDRVQLSELGKSTEGVPLVMAVISAPETIASLDRYRDIQAKLADPRTIAGADEAESLIAEGKTVVLVTCSIHATEVGATQMSMRVGHRLATSDDEAVREILDNVIFLLVPCLNPDGLTMVKDWYDSTLGTYYEGVNPPFLYNTYTGHDNNRDWFMFTQAETRLAVEHCHNAWHPHIVFDMHQTRQDGMRLILPPFIDPIDPNVHPILQANIAMMGSAMAAELTAQGKAGVGINVTYDIYSPSRAYQHYHGGVRILSEAASVRIATPVDFGVSDLTTARGADPFKRVWNHPMPWQGGRWSLRDIVDYDDAAVMACLGNAARYREMWLRSFHAIGVDAVAEQQGPAAYLVPQSQRDPVTAAELLEILDFAAVEVEEATAKFTADGVAYPAGTRVIRLAQPYGAFAKTMLGNDPYPELTHYEGGPPVQPYDNTAHSLPLQMGVSVVEVQEAFEAKTKPLTASFRPKGKVAERGKGKAAAYVLGCETNAAYKAVFRLLADKVAVSRTTEALDIGGKHVAPGAFVIKGGGKRDGLVAKVAKADSVTVASVGTVPKGRSLKLSAPRVGLYKSYVPTAEEGWARFVFDEYGLAYETLVDRDVRQGDLKDRFDVILLPHQNPVEIHEGQSAKEYPADLCGGLGDAGAKALRAFAEAGGTLVAWDGAAQYAARYLDLRVRDALDGVPVSDFYARGSMLRVLLDTHHPIAYGMPERGVVLFSGQNAPAFEVTTGDAVAVYPPHDPLLSGWLMGHENLADKAALASVPVGAGQVVLMGFRVHFRAQARGTYKLLFNAILNSAASG